MLLKILAIILTTSLPLSYAQASIVQNPECFLRITKTEQIDESTIKGKVHSARGPFFFASDACKSHKGKEIVISFYKNQLNFILKEDTLIELGLFVGSTMGSEGPVVFQHWTLTKPKNDMIDANGIDHVNFTPDE
jgi:hypothetical protein